jgi:predicted Rossmann fold flavoprotein
LLRNPPPDFLSAAVFFLRCKQAGAHAVNEMDAPRIVIAGGGAAGFFAAIAAAEANPSAQVSLYEATAHPLAKVRVSGGGRCNTTHACFEPRELVRRYPRGSRELLGPFTRFGPRETIAWFAARGVELKTEADGRMFPITDDSATIVGCLRRAAEDARVAVTVCRGVRMAECVHGGQASAGQERFRVTLTDGAVVSADRLLLATGGNKGSAGLAIAEALDHTIEPPVPSLFTFHIDDPRLRGLEGLSVPNVATAITGTKLRETGPILVTHWGLSGPAVLKLSAWGARELHACDYRATLVVNWAAPLALPAVRETLETARREHARKQVATGNPFGIPGRLWERLVVAAGVPEGLIWSSVSNALLHALAAQVAASEFTMEGKSLNKEEFVTCGGVRLREVDFRTMESRVRPGLHFAGEVLDIDGITGGFNFQAAWTTGWIAGRAMAAGSAGE